MASAVDICNLALGHLGDNATVTSIDPPEGSAQAEHCARFYPMARDSLLEQSQWSFATRRIALAQLANAWPEWQYAYLCPSDALNLIAILGPQAQSDYSSTPLVPPPYANAIYPDPRFVGYEPQPFANEVNESGDVIILTNQEQATLRYTSKVTDTSKFSPLFVDALAWLLASYLAGPILKGDAGAAAARSCYQAFQTVLVKATTSDTSQRKVTVSHNVPWMGGR